MFEGCFLCINDNINNMSLYYIMLYSILYYIPVPLYRFIFSVYLLLTVECRLQVEAGNAPKSSRQM